MRNLRFISKNLVVTLPALVLLFGTSSVFAQAATDGQVPREGVTSYIFSPMAITVLLVLALAAQIVYWQYSRTSNRKAVDVEVAIQHVAPAKRKYDRDSMSKLLKASATVKGNARSLEEAIRLSQLTQPTLSERVAASDVIDMDEPDVAVEVVDEPHAISPESDVEPTSEIAAVEGSQATPVVDAKEVDDPVVKVLS